MYKLGLEKAEEPKVKLPTFTVSWRKQENSRKTSTSASLTMLKPLTVWPDHLTVHQGCILSPCLFNSYAEYIRQNAGLDDAQARIKIADDTTLIAESEEELKSFLMKVKKESEKAGLKLNIQKTKIRQSNPITSWQIDGRTVETVTDYFFGLQNNCRWLLWP